MKQGYANRQVKDICTKGSSQVAQKDLEGLTGDYPIYGASGLIKNVDFYHQEKEYIGLVKDGSGIGRVMFLPPKSSVIGTLQYILPKEGYNIRYIGYCLQSLRLDKYKQGAAIPHIYFKDYGEAQILVADNPDEQKRIVNLLDAEFAKIDALKANAEKNLQNAKDLFQAALKKELEPKGGWVKSNVGATCSIISGYAFDSKGYSSNENDTLLLCGDNIVHCGFRWETIKRWNKDKYEELKRFAIQENDIVLAMDRPWVKSGLKIAKVSKNELPSLLIQRTACIRAKDGIVSDFIYYTLQDNAFSKYLIEQQTGVGVPHISGKQIMNYEISLPPHQDQQTIVAILDALNEKCKTLQANYEKTIALCDDLKQSLLRRAFKGEL